jgi:hypothetical protein
VKLLLKPFILIVLLFPIVHLRAQSSQFTLTTVTNPPQGGTITGAGTYTNGTTVNIQIDAADGWYVSGVETPGFNSFTKRLLLGSISQDNFDPTTITNDTETIVISSNSTVIVSFAPLAPSFTLQPTSQILLAGSQATLAAGVNGRQPLTFQWQKEGQDLVSGTNSSLIFGNIQLANAGTYSLLASNAFGVSNSTSAVITVKSLLVLADGQPAPGSTFIADTQTLFTCEASYTNANIFYTLDGTAPDFTGSQYQTAFNISKSCTLRIIAYSADFAQTVLGDPVNIVIVPLYQVVAGNYGGGNILFNPDSGTGLYRSNTLLTVVAAPFSGWTFMGWGGALTGTNLTNALTVNGPKYLQPTFGTTLGTTSAGHGTVMMKPVAPLYPFGALVQLTALPDSTNYFAAWGNGAAGSQNPISLTVFNPQATASALFAALPANQAALTVIADGGGSASKNPSNNRYTMGTTVTLSASPDAGQQFLGWTGDVNSTANPLSVVMNASKVITARFTRVPTLAIQTAETDLQFSLRGTPGTVYRIESSTNLSIWTPFLTVTNFDGVARFYDPASPSVPYRMFRAVVP